MSNLLLGVHPSCRWFVQTGASNWNRLIDEIRRTDGQRAEAASVDLEPGEWRLLKARRQSKGLRRRRRAGA